MKKYVLDERPTLVVDCSRESSQAMRALVDANVHFTTAESDEKDGPVLITDRQTFRGLERIRQYVEEYKVRKVG